MYIKVRVTPKAKKERITQIDATTFEVAVREPAERNLANARVRAMVAEACGVTEGKTRLISGHRSSSKIFSVESG